LHTSYYPSTKFDTHKHKHKHKHTNIQTQTYIHTAHNTHTHSHPFTHFGHHHEHPAGGAQAPRPVTPSHADTVYTDICYTHADTIHIYTHTQTILLHTLRLLTCKQTFATRIQTQWNTHTCTTYTTTTTNPLQYTHTFTHTFVVIINTRRLNQRPTLFCFARRRAVDPRRSRISREVWCVHSGCGRSSRWVVTAGVLGGIIVGASQCP
jgi:hypothetical protein